MQTRIKGVKLSEQQLRLMSEELNKLHETAQKQLVEHRMYIKQILNGMTDAQWKELAPPMVMHTTYRNIILSEADGIMLGSIQTEPRIKDKDGKPTVSLIYEYPDALAVLIFDHPKAPEALRKCVAGGISIDDDVDLPRIVREK